MHDNFIVQENKTMLVINEIINILVLIIVVILLAKLVHFLFSYIKNGIMDIIKTLFSEITVFKKKSVKNSRANRPSLEKYNEEYSENNKGIPPENIKINNDLVGEEYKGMSFEELKDELNKKY